MMIDIYTLVLTLLHSERPKLYAILAFLSAVGLNTGTCFQQSTTTLCSSFMYLKLMYYTSSKVKAQLLCFFS